MIVTWSLFTMWIVFNLVDIAISWLAMQFGANEVGLLYVITRNWSNLAIGKMALAMLFGGLLVYGRKDSWLSLLTLGLAGVCIYNGWVLWQQMIV